MKDTDYQRWLMKYEIVRNKVIEAWLELATPRPAVDHADVVAQVGRLRQAERVEVRQTWVGAPDDCKQLLILLQNPQQQMYYVGSSERDYVEKTPSCQSGSIPDD